MRGKPKILLPVGESILSHELRLESDRAAYDSDLPPPDNNNDAARDLTRPLVNNLPAEHPRPDTQRNSEQPVHR